MAVSCLNLALSLAAAEQGGTIPEGIVKIVNIQLSKSYSFLKAQLIHHVLYEVFSESPQWLGLVFPFYFIQPLVVHNWSFHQP